MNVSKLAEQVSKYLEAHSALVGPGPMPSKPMREEDRGESRPPAGEKAFRFWEANRIPAKYIGWRVGSLMRHRNAYRDVHFSELLTELYRNPAIIQAWKAAETKQDALEGKAFEKLCYLVAQDILACSPDVQFSVVVNPRDEPVTTRTEARDKDRRITAEDSYRKRYARLREVENAQDVTRTAAVEMVAAEKDCSPATIWNCIAFCEAENSGASRAS